MTPQEAANAICSLVGLVGITYMVRLFVGLYRDNQELRRLEASLRRTETWFCRAYYEQLKAKD